MKNVLLNTRMGAADSSVGRFSEYPNSGDALIGKISGYPQGARADVLVQALHRHLGAGKNLYAPQSRVGYRVRKMSRPPLHYVGSIRTASNDLGELLADMGVCREFYIADALGDAAWSRYSELKALSQDDSDKPLDPKVELALVDMILKKVPLPKNPSLFLTSSGMLTISWRTPRGAALVMVVEPEKVTLLVRGNGPVRTFYASNFPSLSEAIANS